MRSSRTFTPLALALGAIAWLSPAASAQSAPPQGPPPAPAAPGAPKTIFKELPGIDLILLSPAEKAKLMERVHAERCTCGCKDESVAWCLHHHRGCEFPEALIRLAATEISPNYKKAQRDDDMVNWTTHRHPTESMKMEFDYLKGFDLDELSEKQRTMLLLKTNTLPCECGCTGDSLAKCVNVDPTCTTAPAKIREILEELKHTPIW